MFRSNGLFGNDASSYADSVQSNGYSTMDEASSQISNLSRPSAKSIYLQRKVYAASVNTTMDKFQHRVEHLFTCDLDGRELRNVADCVEQLKLLDGIGRVWGQSMLLQVHGPKLVLTDIETKVELESVALSDILEVKAVFDSGVFNSLLTVSVKARRKHTTTVFIFQCEDVRADVIQRDLTRALSYRRENFAKASETKWVPPDYEDDISEPELFVPEEDEDNPSPHLFRVETLSTPRSQTGVDRDADIFNDIISDIQLFIGKIAAGVSKNTKQRKKKKKGKVMAGMPPAAEFAACLHKFKCAFNLLGELNGNLHNPSAPAFVHSLFITLAFVVSHCPEDLPPTIVEPLLTPRCIRLMSEEVSAEEDQLWRSLGDAWNIPSIPSIKWPKHDEDISTHTLEYDDGWQSPEVSAIPEARESVSRPQSPKPAPSQVNPHIKHSTSAKWRPPHSPQRARSSEPKLQRMRVKYDFVSRNDRELTVRKGEIVELLDMSKQWWKVRDSRGKEGFVPNNVLKADDEQPVQQIIGPPVLTKKSKSAEVTAWLQDKGFSKITVRCLGVLSGSILLGMTREELKTVCPEEGGRVFFQLQAVKSALAVSDRPQHSFTVQ